MVTLISTNKMHKYDILQYYNLLFLKFFNIILPAEWAKIKVTCFSDFWHLIMKQNEANQPAEAPYKGLDQLQRSMWSVLCSVMWCHHVVMSHFNCPTTSQTNVTLCFTFHSFTVWVCLMCICVVLQLSSVSNSVNWFFFSLNTPIIAKHKLNNLRFFILFYTFHTTMSNTLLLAILHNPGLRSMMHFF